VKLRTEIQIPESSFKIDHRQKIYLTGSCFSENIMNKFRYYGFDVLANSHGIVYHPANIETCFVGLYSDEYDYTLEDIIEYNGMYFSFNHHSIFAGTDPLNVLANMNETLRLHREHLYKSSVVFITLATSWIYKHVDVGIVANCHKLPAKLFEKCLTPQENIDGSIEGIIIKILDVNPTAKIVFTVSPVKHLKDGFVENQISKSQLLLGIHKCLSESVYYFPAYEIMNDDLRDYRFWKEDMVHPNDLAIDYIWEKLSATYFNSSTVQIMDEVKKLRQFFDHRPLSNDQNRINELIGEKEKKKEDLLNKYPHLNL
jgi:hypothetical protein